VPVQRAQAPIAKLDFVNLVASMSDVTPARIGLLMDYLDESGGYDVNILPSLQLVADDLRERGILERPVEFVVRAVQGLPKGSFRAVRDAFHELVDENCLVIFGPWVSENGVALRQDVEALAEVPCITMAGTETMLASGCSGSPPGRWKRSRSSWRRSPPWTAAAASVSRSKIR
jgi:hypothetical protein